nr:hypothetical protein [Tanacetum cinerariifolium]
MTTLAEFMIIAGTDNRPPMLEKSLYELYIENQENGRMILNSVQNEDGATRTKRYDELSVAEKLQADCDLKATKIILQGLPSDVYVGNKMHKAFSLLVMEFPLPEEVPTARRKEMPLLYALTFKPTVYVSHVRQFWFTARIKTTEEGTKILATVDSILRTVTESSLRRNLKLQDEEGISSLPDAELFENLTLMRYNISSNQKFTFQKGQFPISGSISSIPSCSV